jgi:hypothetical protein
MLPIRKPNLEALVGNSRIGSHGTEKIYGVAPAIVMEIKDDAQNRHMMNAVQVWFPWLQPKDAPNLIAPWARVVSIGAGGENDSTSGWISTPQVGDEVLCGFEYGDITHPYVLGQLWSKNCEIPEPKPGSSSSEGSGPGGMDAAQGGGGGGGGANGKGGEGQDAPQGGGADAQQSEGQQDPHQGPEQHGPGQSGGHGANPSGGHGKGKKGKGFGAVKGAFSKGKGAFGKLHGLKKNPLAGHKSGLAAMGGAKAFLEKLRNQKFGQQKPPPPPPKPKPAIKLLPIRGHVGAKDWLAFHHPILFVEVQITGDVGSITVDLTPKRQPVAMLSVWEPVRSGSPTAKRLVLGSVGDPCNKPFCPHPPHMHKSSWWSGVPGWESGKVTFPTGGAKVFTIGIYPRYAGAFTVKAEGGGLKSNPVTVNMVAHPKPGD